MSTEPGVVSLMGGAFVNVWLAGADPVVIDGNVEMPGRGLDESAFGHSVRQVLTDYGGGVTIGAGHAAVANSGAVQALSVTRDRFGPVPWRRLVEPSARACREGYRIGAAAALYLGHRPRHPLRPRPRGSRTRDRSRRRPARAGLRRPSTPTSPTSWTCLRRKGPRSSPPAPSDGCSSRTWPPTVGSSPRPTSRHTRRSCAPRRCGTWGRGTSPSTPRPPWAARCSRRCSASSPATSTGRGPRSSTSSAVSSATACPSTTSPVTSTLTDTRCSRRSSDTGWRACRRRHRPPTSRPSTSTETPVPSRCPPDTAPAW